MSDDYRSELPSSYDPPRSAPPPAAEVSEASLYCVRCGYNLSATLVGGDCPECGEPVALSVKAGTLSTSGYAVAALVLGIVSIVSCTCINVPALPGLVCGSLAVTFERLAKRQIRHGERHPESRGMATAGLVCGIIGITLGLITAMGLLLVIFADGGF